MFTTIANVTSIMQSPLMPEGVEHVWDNGFGVYRLRMLRPLMPRGVEHVQYHVTVHGQGLIMDSPLIAERR